MENRLQRWRLILGADAIPEEPDLLDKNQAEMDVLLAALYEPGEKGVLKGPSSQINRWLGDIRKIFSNVSSSNSSTGCFRKIGS